MQCRDPGLSRGRARVKAQFVPVVDEKVRMGVAARDLVLAEIGRSAMPDGDFGPGAMGKNVKDRGTPPPAPAGRKRLSGTLSRPLAHGLKRTLAPMPD